DTKSAAKEVPVKEEASSSRVKTEELAPFEERKRGRGRKKKDEPNDEVPPTGAVDEDTMTGQSTIDESDEEDDKKYSKSKTVDESMIKVGDGLKVKYGRGRQLKVYEAKVLKIELDKESNKNKYFVHYSGWNSRYDEWIKKSRIVQVIRDRSPRRRSGKLKNKGETLNEVAVPPNAGTGGGSGGPPGGGAAPAEKSAPVVGPPVLSSQNSVSSVHSNDSALDGSTTSSVSPAKQSSGTPAPKRGRPPNSVKSSVKTEVIVKEEPKSQPSSRDEKQSQPKSPQTAPTPQTPTPSTPVGRRGRPPLSVKKEKLTRSKSVNEEQSTQDSIATSAEESTIKSSEDKKSTNQLSDNESNDKSGEEDRDVVKTKGVTPPELHDENTVENKMADDDEEVVRGGESGAGDGASVAIKLETHLEECLPQMKTTDNSETDESLQHSGDQKDRSVSDEFSSPVKDAFDFDDEEDVARDEEPLKEQLKKKRKAKDESITTGANRRSALKTAIEEPETAVRETTRSTSLSARKSAKKSRKSAVESTTDKSSTDETTAEEEKPTKMATNIVPEVVDEKRFGAKSVVKSLSSSSDQSVTTKAADNKKRKGRKRKDEESPSPPAVAPKKRQTNKPAKLELSHEEDSNLEVQKLFEHQSAPAFGSSSSPGPQESDVSPVDDVKLLPNFTKDILPASHDTTATDFLLCEEAVPASPEKPMQIDDHMDSMTGTGGDSSSPLQESSPHSYHSTPTQSPGTGDGGTKDGGKGGSGGSNSEMENETPMTGAKGDESMKEGVGVSFPSPVHDEDSMVSRPECNKSPISPKKRRRGRVRTTSQSDGSHHKERIGCKTRGSTGRHRMDRQSPLTALEHRLPFSVSQISFNDFVPESKYNFCAPLDKSADPDRRISILQERLQELKKTYMNIKSEVAILDRKKKKARRKERERKDLNNSKHNQSHSGSGDNHNNMHHMSGGSTTPTGAAAAAKHSHTSAAHTLAMVAQSCAPVPGSAFMSS
ncbi:unnamed protein product, partial [Oppiella nova]